MRQTFAIYRIVGNDLPARHGSGQSLANIRFILDNERDFDDCRKIWLLNRLVDADVRDALVRLLEEAGQDIEEIPFDRNAYRDTFLDPSFMPDALNPVHPDFAAQNPTEAMKALGWIFRHKSQTVIGINQARNLALKRGHQVATWVMPLDGQCFIPHRAWRRIARAAARADQARYIVVPLARVGGNRAALRLFRFGESTDEPQIVVRSDARESFDESLFYGDKNKSELLRRLNVPGRWQHWRAWDWAPPLREMSVDQGLFVTTGRVLRLDTGAPVETEKTHGARWGARFEGVATLCRQLDADALDEDRLKRARPCYRPGSLRDPDLLLALSGQQMQTELQSVTDKENPDAPGDSHDYVSLSPYHHAMADGRVERQDGIASAEVSRADYDLGYDRLRLQRTIEAACTLALAGEQFNDPDCLGRSAALIRTWFIDAGTRMNPHTRFAQITSADGDGPRPYGIIDFCDLWALLDAVRILSGRTALTEAETAALEDWFGQFRRHVTESPQGQEMARLRNNIGTYYDLTVGAIAAFQGDRAAVARILDDAALKLCLQVDGDGRLHFELKRTRPLHYQLFNAQAWIALAGLGRQCGRDLWRFRGDDGKSINAMIAKVIDERGAQGDYAGHEANFDRRISIMLSSIPEDSSDFDMISHCDRSPHDPRPGDWKYGFPPCWSLFPAR